MIVRHESDRQALREGCTWDEAAGQRVIKFIESYLILEDGSPFKLLDWQKDFIRSVYCWKRPDGRRRIKLALLTVARKNGKSALTYGLTAYHLIADDEPAASCVSCAVNREQAAQVFDWFKYAIENNQKLAGALHITPSKKLITYPKKNGRYRSLASDAGGNFGHGHSFVIHDELAFHKRDDLYTALKNSTDSRPNGLQVITSTAGWNKNGVFFKLVNFSRKVLSGEIIDTTFQPFIYEVPEGRDLDEGEAVWRLANPSMGVCQSAQDFGHQWNREKRDATSKLNFLRLKANCWTESQDGWITPEAWDACRTALPSLDARPCIVGVDIGATRDLTAISLVFPGPEKSYWVKSWGFVPEGALKGRDGVNTAAYQAFAKDGSLIITPGTATDEQRIISFMDDIRKKYDVKAVVFDKWQSLTLSNDCQKKGLTVWNFPQTHSYFNAPALEFEKLVNNKKIMHDGNALLKWQVGHTYLDRDKKGYCKPISSRPENKKDNLIALLMALSQALQGQASGEVKAPSVFWV